MHGMMNECQSVNELCSTYIPESLFLMGQLHCLNLIMASARNPLQFSISSVVFGFLSSRP